MDQLNQALALLADWQNVGTLLTIIALALSAYQLVEARRTTKSLKTVADAIQTKYIGEHPEFLNNVAALIKKAEKELLIASTIPCHAVFTNEKIFASVQVELIAARSRGVRITSVFSDQAVRRQFVKDQLPEAVSNWERFSSDPEIKEKLKSFNLRYGDKKADIDKFTFDDFAELAEETSLKELDSTFRKTNVLIFDKKSQIYMWIVDGREAIFAIPTIKPSFNALAFWTIDVSFIHAMRSLHEEYRHLSVNL